MINKKEQRKSVIESKKRLFDIYGKDAYKIITKRGHKTSEKKYGKNWRTILSQKGVEGLKRKYGEKWYDITLKRGRERLKEKYGKNWQKELSKLAMKALEEKHIKNFKKRHSNLGILFKNRKLTESEELISKYLKKNKILFKTNVIKNNLEFDIVIPNEDNAKYIIEVSDIKPTTYDQRMKILKLYYQKLYFPKAQHIIILRCNSINKDKKYSLHKITKSFFDKERIILLPLEHIDDYLKKLVDYIKKNEKIILKWDFQFNQISSSNSRKGCITQSKKINKDELKLNNLLLNISSSVKGSQILEVIENYFICVDNFEIYKDNKIAYEITSSNSHNCLRSLAGKILLCKRFNKDIKFIVILNNPRIFNNSSFQFLKDLSDYIILSKDFNEDMLRKAREEIIS